MNSYNEIEPGIYLGGIFPRYDKNFMKKIDVIIDMIDYHGLNYRPPVFDNKLYFNLPLDDSPTENISKYFDNVFKIINKYHFDEHKNIYIHCMAGISRSSTVLIAYYMRKYCLPYKQAYELVKSKRNIIEPNRGFVRQLEEYEKHVINVFC